MSSRTKLNRGTCGPTAASVAASASTMFHNETIFDEENARYLVVSQGRMGKKRVHGCLLHVEIIDGKIWIQRDGTEDGVADDLVEAGIPRSRIVLGFWDPEARKLGDFAAA